LERLKKEFLETGACPYCGQKMRLWAVTQNPMTTWDHDFYICINDECSYLVRGWKVMYDQGHPGVSYRLSFDPVSKTFSPITIPSLNAIKGQLTDDTWPPDKSED
ncbi:MAG: ogr/Delta-like zinc finger family protein, partial [Chloroflexota bacterium]